MTPNLFKVLRALHRWVSADQRDHAARLERRAADLANNPDRRINAARAVTTTARTERRALSELRRLCRQAWGSDPTLTPLVRETEGCPACSCQKDGTT
jgi:hypothetical protein